VNQRRIQSFILIAALFLLGAGGTLSYLTHSRAKMNSITVGTNRSGITEEYEPPGELKAGENVFKKSVCVENTGSVPCFVRVFADFSDSRIAKVSKLSPDGENFYPASEYQSHLPAGWVYVPEEEGLLGGFYYYTGELKAGEKTVPLFKKVATVFETQEEVTGFEILVYSESVQALDRLGMRPSGGFREIWTEFLERR